MILFNGKKSPMNAIAVIAFIAIFSLSVTYGFTSPRISERFITKSICPNTSSDRQLCGSHRAVFERPLSRTGVVQIQMASSSDSEQSLLDKATKVASVAMLSAALLVSHFNPAYAEDELAAKYGGKGFDSSLVDQTCLVDKCSLQAKSCLAEDPSCRKGLTCTAKCMGDNSCITGCMARYGNKNLDNLLKCTIEDNSCIKVAILDGGQDMRGQEPRSIAPVVDNFNMRSLEGAWYKVVGFNPNYDCYACQRNTFSTVENTGIPLLQNPIANEMEVDVEFSMPRMLPDGSPLPPKNEKENIVSNVDGLVYGSNSVGLNDYSTHEVMVFDQTSASEKFANFISLGKDKDQNTYARTAHSEGEMFGLKFWENWYIIGENDPGQPEFKFVYYNGKTRQNTYDGAFVYSRTKELGPEAMKKVYKIADGNGMNPDNFCKIRNGCFKNENLAPNAEKDPLRSILASTKISQLLGVEPVAAENTWLKSQKSSSNTISEDANQSDRAWWFQVGDYLENPNRHFQAMDSFRITMEWPDFVKNQN